MRDLILAILLAWPPFSAEPVLESSEDRATRLGNVADVIAATAARRPGGLDPAETAAALLTIGFWESRFALYVGAGRCETGPVGARCDPDRKGVPRARTYWQLHRAACPSAWAEDPGSQAELVAAARCAAVLFSAARSRCGRYHKAGPIAGAFSGYRSAQCEWRGAVRRQTMFWKVRGGL